MDRHGHRNDELQRNKVRRYHGNPPSEHTQQSHHGNCRRSTAQDRQYYPALAFKNETQYYNQKKQHPETEYFQVFLDKADQIVSDHADSTQKKLGIATVTIHNCADRRNILMTDLL